MIETILLKILNIYIINLKGKNTVTKKREVVRGRQRNRERQRKGVRRQTDR